MTDSTFKRLAIQLLACILRRLIEGDKPGRMKYEAFLLAEVDVGMEPRTVSDNPNQE